MSGPSRHLSWKELGCRDGTPYPEAWRWSRAVPLAREFEAIRADVGKPIAIVSAFRTAAYNARLPGAAKASQHVQGRALDLCPPPGLTPRDLYDVVVARAAEPGSRIRGIGLYPWGVHMDIRPGDHLARWSGVKPVQVAR